MRQPASDDKTIHQLLVVANDQFQVFDIQIEKNGRDILFNIHSKAHYKLDDHLGKLYYADLVLDSQYVLVIYETATHASLVSTQDSERIDIPLPKFPDHRGLSESPARKSCALITKVRGQDHVVVLSKSHDISSTAVVFSTGTTDAQGIMWSPNADPMLVVWESAVHGTKISFFTASGHPVKQLEITSFNAASDNVISSTSIPGFEGLGITHCSWSNPVRTTSIIALGSGDGKTLLREQNNAELKSLTIAYNKHERLVDGSRYVVWQETNDTSFRQQEEPIVIPFDDDIAVNDIQISCDRSTYTSTVRANPRTLWIWQMSKTVSPIAVLIFNDEIRTVLWHPSQPEVMLILTNCKKPMFFCWFDTQLPPQAIEVNVGDFTHTSKWKVQWLPEGPGTRAPLMISSTKNFDIGMLQRQQDVVFYDSILPNLSLDDAEPTEMLYTPTKSSRGENGHRSDPFNHISSLATDQDW